MHSVKHGLLLLHSWRSYLMQLSRMLVVRSDSSQTKLRIPDMIVLLESYPLVKCHHCTIGFHPQYNLNVLVSSLCQVQVFLLASLKIRFVNISLYVICLQQGFYYFWRSFHKCIPLMDAISQVTALIFKSNMKYYMTLSFADTYFN